MSDYILTVNSKYTWKIFFFFMFALFLESMRAYFFWSIPHHVIPGIVAIFSVIFFLTNPDYFSMKKWNIIPFLLFFLTLLYTIRWQNINGYIGAILPFVSLFLFFSLKIFYKAKFLETLTKTLSVILAISLIAWISVFLGLNLPKTTLYYDNGEHVFALNCYYFFIEYTFSFIQFQRFMSIFIEPGYLGTLLVILIYINNFELKRKEIFILFTSLFLTFSIGAYLMLVVAYISYLLRNKRHAVSYLLLITVILTQAYNISTQVNSGYNVINENIIKRLVLDDKGKLSGYNRTDDDMNQMFDNFLTSDNVLLGLGSAYHQYGANVGYKPFIVTYGFIGLFLLFLSYFSGWFFNKQLFTFTITILFIMLFSKGHSEIFWASYLMIYATAMYLPENWRKTYIFETIQ